VYICVLVWVHMADVYVLVCSLVCVHMVAVCVLVNVPLTLPSVSFVMLQNLSNCYALPRDVLSFNIDVCELQLTVRL